MSDNDDLLPEEPRLLTQKALAKERRHEAYQRAKAAHKLRVEAAKNSPATLARKAAAKAYRQGAAQRQKDQRKAAKAAAKAAPTPDSAAADSSALASLVTTADQLPAPRSRLRLVRNDGNDAAT